jgi:hypothetical protein
MKWTAQLLAAMALLAGCGGERTTTETSYDIHPRALALGEVSPSAEAKDLATLRRVTAPLHDFDVAKHAGWSAPITDCMTSPAGGMGFHFGNPAFIDGSVRVDQPELLLFEPESNGRMRLVAVEYIIPNADWHSSQPPRLFGRDLQPNAQFQVWALHVWVWENNPAGIFADWNPNVNCDHTTAVSTMSH